MVGRGKSEREHGDNNTREGEETNDRGRGRYREDRERAMRERKRAKRHPKLGTFYLLRRWVWSRLWGVVTSQEHETPKIPGQGRWVRLCLQCIIKLTKPSSVLKYTCTQFSRSPFPASKKHFYVARE